MKMNKVIGALAIAAFCIVAMGLVPMDNSAADGESYTITLSDASNHLAAGMEPQSFAADSTIDWTHTFAAATGYVLPADITVKVGGSAVAEGFDWDAETGVITIAKETITNNVEITIVCTAGVFEIALGEDCEHIATVLDSETFTYGSALKKTIALAAEEGYALPANIVVKIGGAVSSAYTWAPATGVLEITGTAITGDVEITAVCEKAQFDVELDLTNLKVVGTAPAKVFYHDGFEFVIERTVAGGYTFPVSITVMNGEDELVMDTDYTYTINGQRATIVISEDVIEADVTITAVAVANAIEIDTTGLVNLSGTFPAAGTYGTAVEFAMTADEGYRLPASVKVMVQTDKIDDVWADYSSRCTFVDGTLTIPAAYVVGDIVISAEADVITYNVGSKITNGKITYEDPANAIEDFIFFIQPNEGYKLPEVIYIWTDGENGTPLQMGTAYTYDADPFSDEYGMVVIDSEYVADNIYVRGVCDMIYYHITYVTGTSQVIEQDDVPYGQKIRLASIDPDNVKTTGSGDNLTIYKFVGWMATITVDNEDYNIYLGKVGVEEAPVSDMVITAIWLKEDTQTITVSFNSLGGSDVASQEIAKYTATGEEQILLMPIPPTREGYEWNGFWYTNENCRPEFAVTFGDTAFTGNTTLYCGWVEVETPVTYSVTFYSNGGSSVAKITGIEAGTRIVMPADPIRNGYNFVGWFTNATLGDNYRFDAQTAINSDLSLYAKWTPMDNPQPEPQPATDEKKNDGVNWVGIAFVAVAGVLGVAYAGGVRHPAVIIAAIAVAVFGVLMITQGYYHISDVFQLK